MDSSRVLWFVTALANTVYANKLGQCSNGRTDFLPGAIQGMHSSLSAAECQLAENTKFENYDPQDKLEFDFVVVGAGAAGSVIANKLSANHKWKVLLLEVGGDPFMTTEVPGLVYNSQGTAVDWQYYTEPEPGLYWGRKPRGSEFWPLGKGIGGSKILNGIIYTRGKL